MAPSKMRVVAKMLVVAGWLVTVGLLGPADIVQAQTARLRYDVRLRDAAIAPDGRLARVRIIARDGTSALVKGLTAADFKLNLDRKTVPITRFEPAFADDKGLAVALVMDTSGSMAGAKMQAARRAALSFVGRLGVGDAVAVLTFDEQPRVRLNPTGNKAVIQSVLSRLKTVRRDTALYDALDTARALLVNLPQTRRAILLLTDGQDNVSNLSASDIALFAGHRDIAPLYVLGVGDDVDSASLSRLAKLSGGAYLHASQASSMDDLYRVAWRQLHDAYLVSFPAPPRGSGQHTLQATLLRPTGAGTLAPPMQLTALPLPIPPARPWPVAAVVRVITVMSVLLFLGLGTALLYSRWLKRDHGGSAPAPAWLEVVDGPLQGRRWKVQSDETVIGRGRVANINLPDDTEVSRRHATIVCEGQGKFVIVDDGSTNGIALNGRPVSRAQLHEGDRLQIGRTQCIWRTGQPT